MPVTSSTGSRRAEALVLAEAILDDVELSRVPPIEIARKTYRLARLLDDHDAIEWLRFEVNGYNLLQPDNVFEIGGWEAALRSNRGTFEQDGKHTANPLSLGELQAHVEGGMTQLAAAADRQVSIQSANPIQTVVPPPGNAMERAAIRKMRGNYQGVIDKVVGALHSYVAERYYELRFGSAVETAFETVRNDVDARIADLVPEAPKMLSAAFENAASDNPEHWAGAAAVCRRLLKAAADALRAPGEPKNDHPMTDANYVNRLVDWIQEHNSSRTAADLTTSELEHLGARLDAVDGAGQKGAHESVDRQGAARFLTGTYLLLGDILDLADDGRPEDQAGFGEPTDLNQVAADAGTPQV